MKKALYLCGNFCVSGNCSDRITETKIKQANALLDIVERSQKLGLKLQLADKLLVLNNDDILRIKVPENPNE
jgi:hypothetical protein